MSNRGWIFGCETHRPTVYADSERSCHDVDGLRRLYEARETLLGLDSDLWPDEYRSQLWWLGGHRDCQVALFTVEDPEERIELEPPPDGRDCLPGVPVALAAAVPGSIVDEARRRGIAWMGEEQILRALAANDQGFQVRSIFVDPARQAVGIIVTHPELPMVEEFAEPTWLRARWQWDDMPIPVTEGSVTELYVKPRLLIDQLHAEG